MLCYFFTDIFNHFRMLVRNVVQFRGIMFQVEKKDNSDGSINLIVIEPVIIMKDGGMYASQHGYTIKETGGEWKVVALASGGTDGMHEFTTKEWMEDGFWFEKPEKPEFKIDLGTPKAAAETYIGMADEIVYLRRVALGGAHSEAVKFWRKACTEKRVKEIPSEAGTEVGMS